ncbi:ASCH domain-containing protein [Vibrio coralliilyticus]|uniref:ASCH domain-containing protein n=1 Tax=Vibrio coralliilyticus TaxID=190893 RepID=UPI00148BBACF|nr:ASCH domain-containing protein [Vibrio coralliilyticus]NOI32161.1 ASCH domain-containing protein [Vibrio coralliilyticus]NOI51299.1 ASCH domain-containing protein [Vibrio coralliilyticus]
MSKILHLNLKKIYFDQIKDGSKKEEFRLQNDFWKQRLEGRDYDQIHIKCGYPKATDQERIIKRPWRGFTKKKVTHEHFGGDAFVYAIVVN